MMQPATLTVVEDARGVVAWPPIGVAVDIMPSERNGVGRTGDVVVKLDAKMARLAHRLDVAVKDDGWHVVAYGDSATLDGAPLPNAGWQRLAPGALLGFAGLDVAVRFDVVTAAILDRRCAPAAMPNTLL